VPSAALWEADSISAAEADTPLSADSTLEARTGTEAQFVKPILASVIFPPSTFTAAATPTIAQPFAVRLNFS
jgi:hypothetical protein